MEIDAVGSTGAEGVGLRGEGNGAVSHRTAILETRVYLTA